MIEPDHHARGTLSATLAVRLVGVVIVVIALPGVIAFTAWWAMQLSVSTMDYVWNYLIGRNWSDRLVELAPVVQAVVGIALFVKPQWLARRSSARAAFGRTCLSCGYPLQPTSRVCSECGTACEADAPAKSAVEGKAGDSTT